MKDSRALSELVVLVMTKTVARSSLNECGIVTESIQLITPDVENDSRKRSFLCHSVAGIVLRRV